MSFLAGLGFTSEKPPIVIEFGSRYTKAGFGGEPGPRVIVATPDNLRAANAQVPGIWSLESYLELGQVLNWLLDLNTGVVKIIPKLFLRYQI